MGKIATRIAVQVFLDMFDVAYNQRLGENDFMLEKKIIGYYLDKKQSEACKAVTEFGESEQRRRRINQMYLFFLETYNFCDKGTDEFKRREKELGF